ncbi:MAG TPA: hypothetical protein VN875_22335 [Candidatus Binatus sp.]|jgi:hypothetical protein|nr:hypothetical protein [Candidatus Binatus sp.]
MIQFVFSLLIGIALLLILYFFARGGKVSAEGSAQQLREAKQTLDSLQFGLLPNDLVHRIFAREDLEYVRRAAAPQVQSLFLSERKDISLAWVRRVRGAILSLMRFHRGHARLYAQLNLSTELLLAINFARLLMVCRILEMALYLRGPYAAPGMVRTVASTAGTVCTISEKSLVFLKVNQIDPLKNDPSHHGASV